MDGFEAARKIFIWEIENFVKKSNLIPIIAVTAYDDQKTFQMCYDIGLKGVITKPISAEKLTYIIDRYYFKKETRADSKKNLFGN